MSLNLTSTQLPSFQLNDVVQREDAAIYQLSRDREILQIEFIEGIDQPSAVTLIEDEIFGIEAFYSNTFSAYPGDITHTTECNKQFLPQFFQQYLQNNLYQYVSLYTTERLGIGACNDDITAYRHLLGWIYCSAKKELYTIKYFVPKIDKLTDLGDFFLSFTCSVK